MTMGVPCQHGDVKCFLGDRGVTTSPSVVKELSQKSPDSKLTFFPQTYLAHQHACICILSIFCLLYKGARLFTLPRGSRERGLGDGACTRVATVYNTSPGLLALNSSRDTHGGANNRAPLHKLQLQMKNPSQGAAWRKSKQESLKKSSGGQTPGDPLQARDHTSAKDLHPQR